MAASGFRSKTAQPNGIASQKTRMYYLLPHIFILSLVTSSGLQFCFCSSWIAFSFTPPRKPCTVCTVLHTANLYILFQRTRGRVLHRRAVQVGAAARSTLLSYFFEITISWEKKALRNLTLQWFACVLRRKRKRMRVRNPVHDCHFVILR